MHRGFFLPVKALPPAPNGPGTGGGRCHATYLCGERFNSRPPRGGRPDGAYTGGTDARISIHALREEGDAGRPANFITGQQISIHALREEGDAHAGGRGSGRSKFQSTPSARRATAPSLFTGDGNNISIHALREEGDGVVTHEILDVLISIHALREEGDRMSVSGLMIGI